MPQMCPGCSRDNPDGASACAFCSEELRGLLGSNTLLAGRYRVTRVLGCGGMGAVYLADGHAYRGTPGGHQGEPEPGQRRPSSRPRSA